MVSFFSYDFVWLDVLFVFFLCFLFVFGLAWLGWVSFGWFAFFFASCFLVCSFWLLGLCLGFLSGLVPPWGSARPPLFNYLLWLGLPNHQVSLFLVAKNRFLGMKTFAFHDHQVSCSQKPDFSEEIRRLQRQLRLLAKNVWFSVYIRGCKGM